LEFPQGFLKSHSASVHLQYKAFELRFHNNLFFFLPHKLHALSRSEERGDGQLTRREEHQKGKGRDIGYALAASSCEEANNVEHAPSRPLM